MPPVAEALRLVLPKSWLLIMVILETLLLRLQVEHEVQPKVVMQELSTGWLMICHAIADEAGGWHALRLCLALCPGNACVQAGNLELPALQHLLQGSVCGFELAMPLNQAGLRRCSAIPAAMPHMRHEDRLMCGVEP